MCYWALSKSCCYFAQINEQAFSCSITFIQCCYLYFLLLWPLIHLHTIPVLLHALKPALSFLSLDHSPLMQPLTPAQPSTGPPRLELPDFWPSPDPTSGPSLIKCERRPLLGRENPKDPYNISEDILPDLENDDMFTRRTCAFHSSSNLAWLKYGDFLTSHRRSEPYIKVVIQPRQGQPVYPDIERDDILYRRVQLQSTERPPSGAPDIYHPVPLPEPWKLPPKLQAKLLCAPCPPPQEHQKPEEKQSQEEHPKSDDMLVRKLRMVHIQEVRNTTRASQSLPVTQAGPSVPSSCSEEDLQKWQAIREASRLRYKKRLMVERLGFWVCRHVPRPFLFLQPCISSVSFYV